MVADCILKSGQKREPVSPDEVLQALDYFNIPETLWPEGLIAALAVSQKYDMEAATIMDTVKGKVMATAKDNTHFDITQQYYVYRNTLQAFGLTTDCLEVSRLEWSRLLLQLPQPLKERIQALADKAFLQVHFNPKTKSDLNYLPTADALDSAWSFTIKVYSLSTEISSKGFKSTSDCC